MTTIRRLAVALAMSVSAGGTALADGTPRIAIIIDDLGYAYDAGRRAIDLPGPVGCAFLPDAPAASRLAGLAHAAGKEVLLHLPMQSVAERDPAAGTLHLDTTRNELAVIVRANLSSLPHVVGINNHRGSLLTRHPGHMEWLMQEIGAREGLFFIDSYTTAASVALGLAREVGVPAARRDVFLDPDRRPLSIAREFARLLRLAREHGTGLAIAHPYPETLDFLEAEIPRLSESGIKLVSPGEIVTLRTSEAREPWPPSSYRLQTASKR